MNKQNCRYCPPKKKRKRKKCSNNKIGLMMLALGSITVLILVFPLKCWVLMMSTVLIVFGIILLKK